MIHSFGENNFIKIVTGIITSVPYYKTNSLFKNNVLHQSKSYKKYFEN